MTRPRGVLCFACIVCLGLVPEAFYAFPPFDLPGSSPPLAAGPFLEPDQMTRDGFHALEEGAIVTGMNGDKGIVVHASENRGVKTVGVQWDVGDGEFGGPVFTFTSNQLVWTHWSRLGQQEV